jgi:hypothetical protein
VILIRLVLLPLVLAFFIVLGALYVLVGTLNWVLSGEQQKITLTYRELR